MARRPVKSPPRRMAPPLAKKPNPTADYRRRLNKMTKDQLLNEAGDALGDVNLDAGYYAK